MFVVKLKMMMMEKLNRNLGFKLVTGMLEVPVNISKVE